jgi:hypothetical protein
MNDWKCFCGTIHSATVIGCARCGTKREHGYDICPSCIRKNKLIADLWQCIKSLEGARVKQEGIE